MGLLGAALVTAVAVRCSAWLGDGWIACGLMLAWICIGIAWVILLRIVFEMHQSGLYARNNGKRNGKGEKRDGESDNPPLEREIGAGLDIGLPRQDGQDAQNGVRRMKPLSGPQALQRLRTTGNPAQLDGTSTDDTSEVVGSTPTAGPFSWQPQFHYARGNA